MAFSLLSKVFEYVIGKKLDPIALLYIPWRDVHAGRKQQGNLQAAIFHSRLFFGSLVHYSENKDSGKWTAYTEQQQGLIDCLSH